MPPAKWQVVGPSRAAPEDADHPALAEQTTLRRRAHPVPTDCPPASGSAAVTPKPLAALVTPAAAKVGGSRPSHLAAVVTTAARDWPAVERAAARDGPAGAPGQPSRRGGAPARLASA